MNLLSNAFSILELDADDDRIAAVSSTPSSSATQNGTAAVSSTPSSSAVSSTPSSSATQNGTAAVLSTPSSSATQNGTAATSGRKKKGEDTADNAATENSEQNGEIKMKPPPEYRLPLVWIDLEMTGLNVEVDRILEIACIVTDGSLTKSIEGPDLVIHQSGECLDRMGEWCQSHHAASGLTKKVTHSTITEREAEQQVIEFVKKNVGTYTPMLAGNSVYVDFLFLKKYMPELASLFSHVLVDVSSIKALCIRWFPRDQKKAPTKENKHRAMDDIRESIMELKYYKENIFKASRSRK